MERCPDCGKTKSLDGQCYQCSRASRSHVADAARIADGNRAVETVVNRIQEQVNRHIAPALAAARVLDELRSDSHDIDVLLDADGANWLVSMWQRRLRGGRNRYRLSDRLVERRLARTRDGAVHRIAPGQIDTAESVLEYPCQVGGRWMTVGDMKRAHCRMLTDKYMAESDKMRTTGHFFQRLERALENSAWRHVEGGLARETLVRDILSEAELRAMLSDLTG